jgi:hypothetical protein
MVSANLKDWKEVTKGIYRYVISANAAYEIHINYWNMETDILAADASLYIVGDWHSDDGKNTRERECLLESHRSKLIQSKYIMFDHLRKITLSCQPVRISCAATSYSASLHVGHCT